MLKKEFAKTYGATKATTLCQTDEYREIDSEISNCIDDEGIIWKNVSEDSP